MRVIWGDGIDYEMICTILSTLANAGWSADSIAFGSGGGLLQKLNRDTQKCAFKCSAITVDGVEREVFKDPITDKGKAPKKGSNPNPNPNPCLLYTSPSPRDGLLSRMPSSA